MMPPSATNTQSIRPGSGTNMGASASGVSSCTDSKSHETKEVEVYSSSSGRNSSTTGSPNSAVTDAARAVIPRRTGKRPHLSENNQNKNTSIQLPKLAGRLMGGASVAEEDVSTLGDANTLPSNHNEDSSSFQITHNPKKSLGGLRGYDALDEHSPETQQESQTLNYRHPNTHIDQDAIEDDLISQATASSIGMEAPTLASVQSTQDGQRSMASVQNKIIAIPSESHHQNDTRQSSKSKKITRRQRSSSYYDDDDSSEEETTSGEDLSTSCQRSQTSEVQSILKKKSSFGETNDCRVRTPKQKHRPPHYKHQVSETSTGRNNSKLEQPQKDETAVSDDASGLSFDHCASDMALLGGVLGRDDLSAGELEGQVGVFLRRGAIFAFGLWLFLLAVVVAVAPLDSYQYPTPTEQIANIALLTLLVGVNMNRMAIHMVNLSRGWSFLTSGAMTAAYCIQFIALATVTMITFLPTPIMIDPVVGLRCHLVRWAGWTPMAFLMSFLTEAIDLPLDEETNSRMGWFTGTILAVATLGGGITAFCSTQLAWLCVIGTSIALFIWLYIRLAQKTWTLSKMSKGNTTTEIEKYERARYAVRLMSICATLWTILASSWIACAAGKRFAHPESIWASEWLVLATENCCEAMSKIGYLSVLLDVHEQLFDEVSRTARRLGDLRTYMSAVWDMSSDIVVICSSHQSLVTAAASPSFYDLEHAKLDISKASNQHHDQQKLSNKQKRSTLVMEVDPYIGSYRTFDMDLTQKMNRNEADNMIKTSRNKARMVTPVFNKNLKALSDLVCDASVVAFPEGKHRHVLMKDFYAFDEKEKTRTRRICEATISKLQGKVFMIMIRDVTSQMALYDRIVVEGTGDDLLSTHSKSTGSSSTNQTSNRSNAKSSSKAGSSSSSSPAEKRSHKVGSLYSDDEDDMKTKRNKGKKTLFSKSKKAVLSQRIDHQQSLRTKLIPAQQTEGVLDGSSRSSSHLSFGSVSLPSNAYGKPTNADFMVPSTSSTSHLQIPQHLMAASQRRSTDSTLNPNRRKTSDPPALHSVDVTYGYVTRAFQQQMTPMNIPPPSPQPAVQLPKSTEAPNPQTRRQSF